MRKTQWFGYPAALMMAAILAAPPASADIAAARRAYAKKNYAEAIAEFTRLAKAGNAEAMNWLGYLNYQGEGMRRNYREAWEWYLKAAKAGSSEAAKVCADMAYQGVGIKSSAQTARYWYGQASQRGNTEAMYDYARMLLDSDPDSARLWAQKAREAGDGRGAAVLAALEQKALHPNPERIYELSREAGLAGSTPSMLRVARALDTGTGCVQDPIEALWWYKQAADAGSAEAKSAIRIVGGTADLAQDPRARLWDGRIGAARGSAQDKLALARDFLAADAASPEGIRWLEAAAAAKLPQALEELANLRLAQGRTDEAARLARSSGSKELVAKLIDAGKILPATEQEAIDAARRRASAGDPASILEAAGRLARGENLKKPLPEKALELLRPHEGTSEKILEAAVGILMDTGLAPRGALEEKTLLERQAQKDPAQYGESLAERILKDGGQDAGTHAVQWLEKAARAGSESARLRAAQILIDGEGVMPDPESAAALLRQAKKKGLAQELLLSLAAEGKIEPRSDEERAAARPYRAARGEPAALRETAAEILAGRKPDAAKAAALLRKAASAGDAQARDMLLGLVRSGRAAPANDAEQEAFLRAKASEPQGALDLARFLLRSGRNDDAAQALRAVDSAATRSALLALVLDGKAQEAVPGELADAARAEPGNERARRYLNGLIASGRVAAKTPSEALEAEQQRSGKGEAEAAFALAEKAIKDKDIAAATGWYRKAAAAGSTEAQSRLTALVAGGIIEADGPAEKLAAAEVKVRAGTPVEQLDFARKLLKGEGFEANRAEALKWLRIAARSGSKEAASELAEALAASGDKAEAAEALPLLREMARGNPSAYAGKIGQALFLCGQAPQGPEETLAMLRAGKAAGNADCIYRLAVMIETGEIPSDKDGDPFALYRQAAHMGHKQAQKAVGALIAHGLIQPADQEEASWSPVKVQLPSVTVGKAEMPEGQAEPAAGQKAASGAQDPSPLASGRETVVDGDEGSAKAAPQQEQPPSAKPATEQALDFFFGHLLECIGGLAALIVGWIAILMRPRRSAPLPRRPGGPGPAGASGGRVEPTFEKRE